MNNDIRVLPRKQAHNRFSVIVEGLVGLVLFAAFVGLLFAYMVAFNA